MNRVIFIFVCAFISGCVSYADYYKLDEAYLQRRQIGTRHFETSDEKAIVIASAQVLQDLGFTLEESETNLGLLTASKDRDATSAGQVIGMTLLAALAGTQPVYDVKQRIYVTLVSSKNSKKHGYNVRVEFARIVFNNLGRWRVERITKDVEIYKGFFDKLSQSVFLTANSL